MNQPRHPDAGAPCPDVEQMAAFLDHRLAADERKLVEAHLADCDRCCELLAELTRTVTAVPARTVEPARSRSWLIWGGWAAAVMLSAWLWNQIGRPPAVRPEIAELVAAVSQADMRPVQARLTGGFRHLPPPSAQRAPGAQAPVDVQLAALTIQKRVEQADTPASAAALGVARLVVGDYDAAVEQLSAAVTRDPSLRYAWSDLAAAYLARARSTDLVRAVDAARRATEGEEPLPEAWFNLALACERVGLSDEARAAWNRVIADEAGTPWADEARQQLVPKNESNQGSGRDTNTAEREHLEDVLLPRWANAVQTRDTRAQTEALAAARISAARLRSATGDGLLVAVVAALERGGGAAQRDLAAGHLAYARGRQLQSRDQVTDAARAYKEAVDTLGSLSPYGDWATLWWLATERDVPDATTRLHAIADRAARDAFHNTAGRASWLLGLRSGLSGDFAASLPLYHRAAAAFARTGEAEWINAVMTLIAEAHELLGDYDTAWDYRLPALIYADRHAVRASARWALVGGAFRAALRQGLDGAATTFQDGLIGLVQGGGTPVIVAQQLIARARLRAQRGDREAAVEDLDAADERLRAIADARVQTTVGADIAIERALLAPTASDRVRGLTSALTSAAAAQLGYRRPALYRARASAHADLGAWPAAADDLTAARAAALEQRATLTSTQLRYASFEETWPIFVDSARVAVLAGDRTCSTFDLVETGRSETMAPRQGRDPITLEEIQGWLAADAAVVAYVTARDRTLAWVMTARHCEAVDLTLPRETLNARIAETMSAVTTGGKDWRSAAAALHDALLTPLADALVGVTSLVIVPDAVTARIPFAVLIDRATGRLLTERYTLALSPSVTTWAVARERASTHDPARSPAVLAIGNPESRDTERALPDLPFATREALEVAEMFPRSVALTGPAATRAQLLRMVAASDILHFAGHAVAHDRLPWMSRLVLAAEPGTDGRLPSLLGYELLDAQWSHLRMAFLSACSTAGTPLSGSAGWFGFATPLLAAGVPTVVVTLWDVNDEQTRTFARAFYRHLRAGLTAAAALQRTQVAMLRDPGQAATPAAWAAFVVIGAGDQTVVSKSEESE